MTAVPGQRRSGQDSAQKVACIACGEEVRRPDAREYDKYGDRWTREGKEFEFLCKACFRECSRQPRDGLEQTLCRAGAGETDRSSFLGRYYDLVTDGGYRSNRVACDESAAGNAHIHHPCYKMRIERFRH